jgi:hypothetical protein
MAFPPPFPTHLLQPLMTYHFELAPARVPVWVDSPFFFVVVLALLADFWVVDLVFSLIITLSFPTSALALKKILMESSFIKK